MRILLMAVLLVLPVSQPAMAADTDAVLVLVRHAEKQAGEDPCLTGEGKARAQLLARMLGKLRLRALLSTDYCRTRETLRPLAAASGLEIDIYEPLDLDAIRDAVAAANGGAVVLAGHSNTLPEILQRLGQQVEPISEEQYDKLFILTFNKGAPARLVELVF